MDSSTIDDRLARLEAESGIRQLAVRYALAVDTRDLDALVALFVPDVDCGRWGTGRSTLRSFYDDVLRRFGVSVHFVGNHVIDLDGDRASGVVYCRAEHEVGDRWIVQAMQYVDEYALVDDAWCFVRRKPLAWWARDELERPIGPDWNRWPGKEAQGVQLPDHWPSWGGFWASGSRSPDTH